MRLNMRLVFIFLCFLKFSSSVSFNEKQKDKALNVLGDVLDLGKNLTSGLAKLPKYGPGFAILGGILEAIQTFLPAPRDTKFEAIIGGIRQIKNMVKDVKETLERLSVKQQFQNKKNSFMKEINRLEEAAANNEEATLTETNDTAREHHITELNDICSGGECIVALKTVISFINGDVTSSSILSDLYNVTNGHKFLIEEYSLYLSEELTPDLETMSKTVDKIIHACVRDVSRNLKADVIERTSKDKDKKTVMNNIKNLREDKYLWLDMEILVYDAIQGSDKHCFDSRKSVSMLTGADKQFNLVIFIRNHTKCSLPETIITIARQSINLEDNSESKNATSKYMQMIDSFMGYDLKETVNRSYWGAAVIKKDANVLFSNYTGSCVFSKEDSEFLFFILPMKADENFKGLKVNNNKDGSIKNTSITVIMLIPVTLSFLFW